MSDDHYKNLFTNESIAMTKGNNMSTKDHWASIAGSLIELAGERDDLNNENDNLKQGLARTQGHLDDMTVENARLEEENQELRRGQGHWPETPTVPRFISQNELEEGQEVGFIGVMNAVVGRIAFIEEGEVGLERGERWLLDEDDTIVLLNEALTGADKVRASRPGTVWIDSTGQHWQWDGEKIRLLFGENKQFIGGPVEPHESDWELSDLPLIAEPWKPENEEERDNPRYMDLAYQFEGQIMESLKPFIDAVKDAVSDKDHEVS